MRVLTGASLIDGTGRGPIDDATITVDGGRITDVGEGRDRIPAGAEVVELDGHTVLPGLIDAHSHLGLVDHEGLPRMPLAVQAAHIFDNCQLALDAGFVTCRDVGGIDGGMAEAARRGLVRSPRLLPSGPIIIQTGGHGDPGPEWLDAEHRNYVGSPGLTQLSVVADGPEEVRTAARRNLQRGAAQIKVCISGGIVSLTDDLSDTQLTVSELVAAVEEATARGTYVTAHAHNSEGIRNGLEAGLECFEHGTFLDDETIVAVATRGAAIVPTLAVVRLLADHWREWGLPEEVVPRVRGIEEAMADSTRRAYDAGVAIGSGSDLLGPRQDRRGLELALKAEILGPMAAIESATRVNAEILRLGDEIGTVEPGKRADLTVLVGDPLAEPAMFDAVDRVSHVFKDGALAKGVVEV